MKKLLSILILGMFLISFTSALDSLGTFKQNDCIYIKQSCGGCSYVNISTLSYPNSSAALSNIAMSSFGSGGWNTTFCDTTELGRYDIIGVGDENGVESDFATFFTITGGGSEPTIPQALMYGIVLFILLILFIGSFIWFNSFDWGNYTTSPEGIMQVNYGRAKKTALFFLSYLLLILFLFVGKTMTESFMFLDDTPVFFDVFFMILLVSIAPVLIAATAIIILTTITDNKLQKLISRGLGE